MKALDLVLGAELVAFQVGTLFADKLATSSNFKFGAVTYTDFNTLLADGEEVSLKSITKVVVDLSLSVSNKIADELGTFKLSNVFRVASKIIMRLTSCN
ncbi:hypothetical protein P0F65_11615 [Sphingomonas sp. I4]